MNNATIYNHEKVIGKSHRDSQTALLTNTNKDIRQPLWQRVILLFVLGYEGAGALTGGALLIIAPDGRLMEMPAEIMNGVFRDFLFPGIILTGLGILNTAAFIAVLRRNLYDWLMSGLALYGLAIWFITEIIILQELHWLHAMWGLPVLVGCLVAFPLISARSRKNPAPE